jgi:hypothetical protein
MLEVIDVNMMTASGKPVRRAQASSDRAVVPCAA